MSCCGEEWKPLDKQCQRLFVYVSTCQCQQVLLGTSRYLKGLLWVYLVTFEDEPFYSCKLAEDQLYIVFSIVLNKMPRQHNRRSISCPFNKGKKKLLNLI